MLRSPIRVHTSEHECEHGGQVAALGARRVDDVIGRGPRDTQHRQGTPLLPSGLVEHFDEPSRLGHRGAAGA